MERKLPKNIRQIGNVSDNPKVYVEDYVDTFINQISEKAKENVVGAFLIGETFRKEEQDYIFIHGAVQMEGISMKDNEFILGDKTWKKACEQGKRYFAGNTILGWVFIAPNLQLKLNVNIIKTHERLFMKKSRMLIMKDSIDKEESFFVYKYNDLMEIGGHYIYYEKNPEMQDYMIANRKQNCVTPSESYEDRVTKDFRSVINKKNEVEAKRKQSQKSYVASVALVLVVVIMGITSINNYDKLKSLPNVVEGLVGNVLGNEEDEELLVESTSGQSYIIINGSEDMVEMTEEQSEEIDEDSELDYYSAHSEEAFEQEDDSMEVENDSMEVEDDSENADISDELAQGDIDEYTSYVVKEDDTLVSISRAYYGGIGMVEEICSINDLKDSDYIYVGQVLYLP